MPVAAAQEPAYLALIAAIGAALTANPNEIWADRVHLDLAPAGTDKPYAVIIPMTSTETGKIKAEDAEAIVAVKVVAVDLAIAAAGAARLTALLRDKGVQDTTSDPLNGGTDWQVIHSRKLVDIHMTERVSGAEPVYHAGAQFRFRLERK